MILPQFKSIDFPNHASSQVYDHEALLPVDYQEEGISVCLQTKSQLSASIEQQSNVNGKLGDK